MEQSQQSQYVFLECVNCNGLFVWSFDELEDSIKELVENQKDASITIHTDDFQSCPFCNKDQFRILFSRFLVQCVECKSYWPKYVLRRIYHSQHTLTCPDPSCGGKLVVRAELIEEEGKDPLFVDRWEGQSPSLSKIFSAFPQTKESTPSPIENKGDDLYDYLTVVNLLKNTPIKIENIKISWSQSIPPVNTLLSEFEAKILSPLAEIKKNKQSFSSFPLNKELVPLIFNIYRAAEQETPFLRRYFLEEETSFIYYVGEIRADLSLLIDLFEYFSKLIEKFPWVKIVILGSVSGVEEGNWLIYPLIAYYSLKFSDNVVFLRGPLDFPEFGTFLPTWENLLKAWIQGRSSEGAEKNETLFTLEEISILKDIYFASFYFLSLLPIFHIAIIEDTRSPIFASASGIPIDEDGSIPTLVLMKQNESFLNSLYPIVSLTQLDEKTHSILFGVPEFEKTFIEQRDPDKLQHGLFQYYKIRVFNEQQFLEFIGYNRFYLCVRANSWIGDPLYLKYYENRLCTIISPRRYSPLYDLTTPTPIEGKIIRVITGSTPGIISTQEQALEEDIQKIL